jgi:hypothetical protein
MGVTACGVAQAYLAGAPAKPPENRRKTAAQKIVARPVDFPRPDSSSLQEGRQSAGACPPAVRFSHDFSQGDG